MKNENLVTENMNLVYYLVRRYYPTFVKNEDVIQSGFFGLCKAADTFDESKGANFGTYASRCILNAIRNEIRFEMVNVNNDTLSLDYSAYEFGEDTEAFGQYIAVEDNDPITMIAIKEFSESLTEQERNIIDMRANGATLQEISDKYDYGTRQNVCRLWHVIQGKWRKYNED